MSQIFPLPPPAGEPAPPPFRERLLDLVFGVYRRVLSPVLAAGGLGHCRYRPTCSEYAHVALARHGWLRGSFLALRRLSRCHPWAAGGLDLVPPNASTAPAASTPEVVAPLPQAGVATSSATRRSAEPFTITEE